MQNQNFTLSKSILLNAPLQNVYEKLINPHEQLKWNTLYQRVEVKPEGEIKTGTIMTGTFKGSGKSTVYFQNVIPNSQFTHHSKLMLFNFIFLADFSHQYKVEELEGKTKFTQTVHVKLSRIGQLLKKVLENSFAKRMPESFAEFKAYVEKS
jgi:hypothetical protein